MEDRERRARAQHEAEIAVSVASEHVVRVFEVGTVDETPFIAMEHVLGSTLGAVIRACMRRKKAIPLAIVSRLFGGALDGLHALHSAVHPESGAPLGVVHRDLSPGNLLIAARDGRSVLIDLGLGRSNIQKWRTQTGMLMGTPGYMAPEQTRGERTDARTDLYALGVLLWETIALDDYIPRDELAAMIRMMCDPRERWANSGSGAPRSLEEVVHRALSPDPADRFEDARAMKAALFGAVPPAPVDAVLGAMPEELAAGWRETAVRLEELLEGSRNTDVSPREDEQTTVLARRTMVPATVKLEGTSRLRGVPIAIAMGFVGVTVAAATATFLMLPARRARVLEVATQPVVARPVIEPRPVPIETSTIAEEPSVTPADSRPRAASEGRDSRPRAGNARRDSRRSAGEEPRPAASEAEIRGRLTELAKTAGRLPRTERSSALIARINRLLALPALDRRDAELADLEAELQRLRAE